MVADTVARTSTRAATRVMSCDASVVVVTDRTSPALATRAIERLHELEQRWSRFLPTSEISGLNAADGEPRIASCDTVRLVTALVQSWHATNGCFDPTLLGSLVELGYAASRDDATLRTSLGSSVAPQGRPDGILINPEVGSIQLPHGTALDAGGLGKGLAADIVVEELVAAGAVGALVEIGGDVRVSGVAPVGDAWTIAIAPVDEDPPRFVELLDGGVATSTSRLRRWELEGEQHHHLLDPRTLRSADTDTVSCTVIAGSAAWAEAFTKVAFIDPIDAALDAFDHHGLAASITTADHRRHMSTVWKQFCR